MLYRLIIVLSLFTASRAQEVCPELPDTGVEIGQPVPIKPEDIPRGCSNHEILVGSTNLTSPYNTVEFLLTLDAARGTSEPSFPVFGVIVGDPVVSNVSAKLSGVQGYPVQVSVPALSCPPFNDLNQKSPVSS